MMDIRRLVQLPGRVWKKFHSQALILLYHRVKTLNTDPQLLSVTPEHFAEHLEYISEYYNPISLSEVNQALIAGKVLDKSVIITFDDGYVDNLWNAKSLLEKHGIPATVFVTSGSVGSDREFWWDDLERLLLLPVPEQLPDRLELTIMGEKKIWNLLGENEDRSLRKYETEPKPWNVTMASDPTPRHLLYRDLHRLLKSLSFEERESILSAIAQWAGVSRAGRETHRPLTASELQKLDQSELIEIGAHTITHTMLSRQPISVQTEEIVKGKALLEEMLGHEVQSFSYPFGGRIDFSRRTAAIVKEAGFSMACVNYGTTLIRGADPHHLPRVLARNWDVQEFSSRMRDWFNE